MASFTNTGKVLIVVFSLGVVMSYNAWALGYTVTLGDTLSEISHRFIPGPIWGDKGSVKQVIALNPELKGNPNFIIPGQVIQIPQDSPKLAQTEQKQNRTLAEVSPKPPPLEVEAPEQYSLLSIAPQFSFSRINSTDATTGAQSVLGSGLNYGAALGWEQIWSKTFETGLFLSGESVQYSTTDASRGLDHSSLFLGTIDLQAKEGGEGKFQIFSKLGISQTPFLRGESSTENTLDSVSVPHFGLGVITPLYASRVFLLGFSAEADYLAPVSESTYVVRSGYGLRGALSLEQNSLSARHSSMRGELFYQYQSQNTSITQQNDSEVGVALQFSFDFFSDTSSSERK